MNHIVVDQLSRTFRAYQKQPGLLGSLKALVKREHYDIPAVKDVSFTIDQGELVGFIGPNGAGKTTTLKMLSGLLYPTSGSVTVDGYTPFERKHPFLKQISLVMGQKNQLWWDLPPMESFLLNKEIYDVPTTVFKKRLDELVTLMGVSDVLNVQVRKLSLGQRMKCELIAALLHGPRILFLDEPTIGLDVVVQQGIRQFIRDYNKREEATIILTSHYMQDVQELCKRIIVIDRGQIMYDGPLTDIVKKFSQVKTLIVTFEADVAKGQLEKVGKLTAYAPKKATFEVAHTDVKHLARALLDRHPVEDLDIQEEPIEQVIAKVFSSHGSS